MALRIVATKPNPALVTPPVAPLPRRVGGRRVVPLPRGISRHIVRIVRLGQDVYAVKQTREQWANREYRLLRDLRRLGLPGGRARRRGERARGPGRRGDRAGPGHPAPAVLPALPVAVQPRAPARQPAEDPRRAGRAARAAAPVRVLLGRRVAVERAVPAQRRRVRGVPRRRRDRRAARHAQPRPALARPRGGADQHLRRAARPAGRRAAQREVRGRRHRRPAAGAVRRAVGRAHRHRGVHHRRDLAHRAAHGAAQRARLRRRRARHRHRLGRLDRCACSPRSSRPTTTPASCSG